MDYSEAIAYLMSFTDMERGFQASASPTMSLASVRSLLSRLNDPHLGRGTVHITGSKGKGSTATMVEGILRRQGYTTALFTSPHLHSFTERIAIDGDAISPEEFAAAVDAIRPAVEAERNSVHGNVSTFGVLTALFFWLVRAQARPVQWQVVEVGLGGTYDATNVFDAPDVAVITPVSLEHTAILGNTPAEIATDKAGIIKRGASAILAMQRDLEVAGVVRARCQDVGAELTEVGRALRGREQGEVRLRAVLRAHGAGQRALDADADARATPARECSDGGGRGGGAAGARPRTFGVGDYRWDRACADSGATGSDGAGAAHRCRRRPQCGKRGGARARPQELL